MRDCPQCKAPIANDAICCNACGWARPGTKPKVATASGALPDPLRWNCIDVDAGQRCAALGVFSSSTQGGDRWYCADHFPAFRSMRSGRRAEPTAAFREIAKRLTQPQPVGDLIEGQAHRFEDDETRFEREAIQAEGNGRLHLERG